MTNRRRLIATLLVIALGAAACGGDSSADDEAVSTTEVVEAEAPDSTEPAASTSEDAVDDANTGQDQSAGDVELPFESGEGTFSVDGNQVQADWVVRCETEEDAPGERDDRDIELIAYSEQQGVLILEVGTEDLEGMGDRNYTFNRFGLEWGESVVDQQIEGFITGPDGLWYFGEASIQLATGSQTNEPLAEPPYVIEGNRITGSVDIAAIDPEQADGSAFGFDLSIPTEQFDCSQL